MNILFQKVNTQHELVNRFNQKMETQASSFSEMSAHATRRLRTVDRSWEAGSIIVGQLAADATLRPLSVLRPRRSCADQPVDALTLAPGSVPEGVVLMQPQADALR